MPVVEGERVRLVGAIIKESIDWLESIQNDDGGFPYDDKGSPSGAWTSAGILWALGVAGESPSSEHMLRCLDWIMSQQHDDGSLPLVQKGKEPAIDSTAQGILAAVPMYKVWGREDIRTFIEKTSHWLLANRRNNQGWGMWPGDRPTVASSAFAMRALHAANQVLDSKEITGCLSEAKAWLLTLRHEESGWGAYAGNPPKAASTALALLALIEAGDVQGREDVIGKSVGFLEDTQRIDGSWADLIERQGGYTFVRQGTPYCLMALLKCGLDLSNTAVQKGVRYLLQAFTNGKLRYQDSDIVSWSTRDGLLALSTIYSHVELAQVVSLLDQNLQMQTEIVGLRQEIDRNKERLEGVLREVEDRVDLGVQRRLDRVQGRISMLKILVVFLAFTTGNTLVWLVKLVWNLSTDEVAVLFSIWLALWAFLTVVIHGLQLE